MELHWNFQRGGGGFYKKNPFREGGTCTRMDIVWNYTVHRGDYVVALLLISGLFLVSDNLMATSLESNGLVYKPNP